MQKACSTAGLDYDEVISQTVVWQAPVTTAADGASTAKQDGEDVKPPAGLQTACCALLPGTQAYAANFAKFALLHTIWSVVVRHLMCRT